MVVLTDTHLHLARQLGACHTRYKVGTPISEIAYRDLAWMEARLPEECQQLALALADELGISVRGNIALQMFGCGCGFGDRNYGFGHVDGSGDGDGSGYGNYGSDYCYGYSYVDGSGSGSGEYGDGSGSGSGEYGDGEYDGDGYGSGDYEYGYCYDSGKTLRDIVRA